MAGQWKIRIFAPALAFLAGSIVCGYLPMGCLPFNPTDENPFASPDVAQVAPVQPGATMAAS